jgi:hypothetical protein
MEQEAPHLHLEDNLFESEYEINAERTYSLAIPLAQTTTDTRNRPVNLDDPTRLHPLLDWRGHRNRGNLERESLSPSI